MVRKDIVDTKGNKLQDILDERRLNMATIARKAEVSVEVIRRIRDGKTVRREKFLMVAYSLELAPNDILPNWKNE